MKKLLALAAVASVAAFAAPAFAASNGGVGFSSYSVGDFNISALNGRYGVNSGVLGIEGEAAIGVQSDSQGSGSSSDSVKLTDEFGGFVTAQIEPAKQVELYARVGAATATFKEDRGTGPTATKGSDAGSGPAYGVGGVFMFNDMSGIRVDFTEYDIGAGSSKANIVNGTTQTAGSSADVWSVSLVRKFK